jgi:hypothetical protein
MADNIETYGQLKKALKSPKSKSNPKGFYQAPSNRGFFVALFL